MGEQERFDEIMGITRCVRCGHRLEDEVECPFCSIVLQSKGMATLPKWIYMTAYFLTSPLSAYSVIKNERLNAFEKVLALSGCLFWPGLYLL